VASVTHGEEAPRYRGVGGEPCAPVDGSAESAEGAEGVVEVVIRWGDASVLHVEHVSGSRPFHVGEAPVGGITARDAPVDYLMGREVLGLARMPVVLPADGVPVAVIPPGADGEVAQGNEVRSLEALRSSGALLPCAALPDAWQVPLTPGVMVTVRLGGFTFTTRVVRAGERVARGFRWDRRLAVYLGGSAALFVTLLMMFQAVPPRAGALAIDGLDADNRLVRFAIQPPEARPVPETAPPSAERGSAATGARHVEEEGQMGREGAARASERFAIAGPEDNPDPHMAREAARERAASVGALGVLRTVMGTVDVPTSPFGRDTALGRDAMSALGHLFGPVPGEAGGPGGLGMRGPGRGTRGDAEGTIGLGGFDTIGGKPGFDPGAHGRRLGDRTSAVPKISTGKPEVRGTLGREIIRRVIRRHINEVRFCYEQDLAQRPSLAGRVSVRFIVSPTGAVQAAGVDHSTLGAPRAEACVAQAVRRWTFPAPEDGGLVIVTYPFVFTASGQ
jgi:TonB family protein